MKVFAWPPVGAIGAMWSEEAPVQISRSMTTGAQFISATQRKRRRAALSVSGLSVNRTGAGYVEVLKRLLEGIHCVRLYSLPINRHYQTGHFNDKDRQGISIDWLDDDVPLSWKDAAVDLLWFDGAVLFGTLSTSGGFPAVTVAGLPPNALIARPGEFVTIYETPADKIGSTAQVMTVAHSNDLGTAVIRLVTALAFPGRISIGVSDAGVFQPMTPYPSAMQPVRGDWSYAWEFREVFEDEVGPFEEVNPWPKT